MTDLQWPARGGDGTVTISPWSAGIAGHGAAPAGEPAQTADSREALTWSYSEWIPISRALGAC